MEDIPDYHSPTTIVDIDLLFLFGPAHVPPRFSTARRIGVSELASDVGVYQSIILGDQLLVLLFFRALN
jgi:hypothetical protein